MKKRFRTKRHVRIKFVPYLIILVVIFIFIITLTYISNLKLIRNNVVSLLENSNIYSVDIKSSGHNFMSLIIGVDMNSPTSMLENISNYEGKSVDVAFNFGRNDIKHNNEVSDEPLVYIYNTHQTEEYVGNSITPTPTVLTGAYYLRDLLENLGVRTLVEGASIPQILSDNNWNYAQSYRASRINLEKIKNDYPSIKLFIDFHRDSVSRSSSTVTLNGKECAKVLFVIGKEHDNYLDNLDFTNSLNDIIKTNYPTLTKGILQKEGPGVNGIYNQDVDTGVILMEVGGGENTLDEVTNTLDLIAPLIKESLNEK